MQNTYYDDKYFDWQKDLGKFGGKADLFKFEQYIEKMDVILDFGCGGGYILDNLDAKRKIGVEINDVARLQASEKGIEVYKDIDSIENESVDKIISNHALEHTHNPLDILIALREKLKTDGKCIFAVPHDCPRPGGGGEPNKWNENDINMHLYSWNQMTLGNLFKQAGYTVLEVEAFQHRWPPNFSKIVNKHGWEVFHKKAVKYAKKVNNYQIKIIAKK